MILKSHFSFPMELLSSYGELRQQRFRWLDAYKHTAVMIVVNKEILERTYIKNNYKSIRCAYKSICIYLKNATYTCY